MFSALVLAAAATIYTLPQNIHWIPDTSKGVPHGSAYALLRGKMSDKCGTILRGKFPDGFVYPWHANHVDSIATVLQGTLVIGLDKNHRKSAEHVLPAGSIVQGLRTEPHYTRAVGETIFDIYTPC